MPLPEKVALDEVGSVGVGVGVVSSPEAALAQGLSEALLLLLLLLLLPRFGEVEE